MAEHELDKIYQPADIESFWANTWEKQGFFQPNGLGKPYCIMLPPPNVTGTLHMGHGFQYSLMDALIRYHRMQGDNTHWQAGTDHAGIATQMVVERQLAQQHISRHDLGRDAFLKKVWAWRHQSGQIITQQIRRLGASMDWSHERFSMDDNISHATIEAFVRLYNDGLIYRGKKLINWDPQLQTAISDLEVISEEEAGHLWYIRYPVANSKEMLVVATTRPETMLGDTAVAVHPDDDRYKHFIGQQIELPLTNRHIPVIADNHVDPAFGTGCVKITPAHDFNDYAIGQRHQLPMINIFTTDAKLNETVPEHYRELNRFDARKKIVADLKTKNLLEKIEPHTHTVPRGDRSGSIIEPRLMDQWFVKMKELAKLAIDTFQKKQIEFIPAHWGEVYLQWLENIEDWCISRQLWWGHRIPVWYDHAGKMYVGHHEKEIREKYKLKNDVVLQQDEDVLDTWFSASLWPFATLGWPDATSDFTTFYPTNVLVTGFDIIFFWVARMVMMGLKLTGQIPFRQVTITGLIRDSQGQKMSKSKGNILDPIDLVDGISLEKLIEKRVAGLMQSHMEKRIREQTKKEFPNGITPHGTDALRFTFCALATTNRNINFDLNRLEGSRHFCNKIWNAARYVLMNISQHDIAIVDNTPTMADQWILSRLQHTIQAAHVYFSEYRFDQLAKILYEFIWNDYCDWYLELSKCDLTRENMNEKEQHSTRYTLIFVLENMMRLLHPLMPFITEAIWQKIAPLLKITGPSIMLQPYPVFNATQINATADSEIAWLQKIVIAIRNIRGEIHLSPAQKIPVIFDQGNPSDRLLSEKYMRYLKMLGKIETITWKNPTEKMPETATAMVSALEIHIPLAGLMDQQAELTRLQKEIEKLEKLQIQLMTRLSNRSFTEKAPTDIVQEVKTQLENNKKMLGTLKNQCERMRK